MHYFIRFLLPCTYLNTTIKGIFLNYCWSIEKLQSSYTAAADRTGDVYVGIDVFGRGCPGGGGFNTLEALQMIAKGMLNRNAFELRFYPTRRVFLISIVITLFFY